MKNYTHECFGSFLSISIESNEDLDSIIRESFLLLDDFESKYSRFIKWNILSKINNEKKWVLPKEIIMLIELAKKISVMTHGYFDITVLPVLENNGYWIEQEILETPLWYKNIECDGTDITLKNNISIEFGSFGKWYALDLLYNSLIKHSHNFTINFGGDIRVAGKKTIQLEDPGDDTKSIGSIEVENGSIASSAWNKRILSKWHHLIDIKSKDSQDDKIAVYVTHKLWVFADIFATALFVCPLKLSLEVLEQTPWLEALIIAADWKIYKSKWYNCTLNI